VSYTIHVLVLQKRRLNSSVQPTSSFATIVVFICFVVFLCFFVFLCLVVFLCFFVFLCFVVFLCCNLLFTITLRKIINIYVLIELARKKRFYLNNILTTEEQAYSLFPNWNPPLFFCFLFRARSFLSRKSFPSFLLSATVIFCAKNRSLETCL